MRSECRGFESRSGHLIFSGICSAYSHIRVNLSDEEQYMFEICHVTNNVYRFPFVSFLHTAENYVSKNKARNYYHNVCELVPRKKKAIL